MELLNKTGFLKSKVQCSNAYFAFAYITEGEQFGEFFQEKHGVFYTSKPYVLNPKYGSELSHNPHAGDYTDYGFDIVEYRQLNYNEEVINTGTDIAVNHEFKLLVFDYPVSSMFVGRGGFKTIEHSTLCQEYLAKGYSVVAVSTDFEASAIVVKLNPEE